MKKLLITFILFCPLLAMASVQEFIEPRVEGLRMDACLYWGEDCKQKAADYFCLKNDFSKSIHWRLDIGIGEKEPTKMLVSKKICASDRCSAFSTIVCYKR